MTRVRMTTSAIDVASAARALRQPHCGAYVSFEGWVRNHNAGRDVVALDYELYEPVAVREANTILSEARARFDGADAAVWHRHGPLAIGDCAVWVGATAAHRDEAFAACRYVLDEVKARLPIWKREHYADGTREWVNCARCASAALRSQGAPGVLE